ncbi:MAG: sigma-70 family RNA polymerase sigma factor [Deltaproteobacteria bacterium]|nr:sigma-70 family RNA polymerase sigma factor [Deltaproteobacteria bacterium]
MAMTYWPALSEGLWGLAALLPVLAAGLRAIRGGAGGDGTDDPPDPSDLSEEAADDPLAEVDGEKSAASDAEAGDDGDGSGEGGAARRDPFGCLSPYRGPQKPDPDVELVAAAAQGDAAAYRGLVERYQSRIYGVCYGMMRNSEDARDCAQEAFVKAYRNLDKFRYGSSFYHWLCRIAVNVSIDLLRRQKIRRADEFDEGYAARESGGGFYYAHHRNDPARELERKGLNAKIYAALDTLPAEQRQVLILREMDGLAYKEIADVMGIPEGTVMSRLFYARKKMQALLKEER